MSECVGGCYATIRDLAPSLCQISIADISDAGKLLWEMIDEHANCW